MIYIECDGSRGSAECVRVVHDMGKFGEVEDGMSLSRS